MSHTPVSPGWTRNRVLASILSFLAAAVLTAAPAHAGLSGLTKAAKNKAAQAAGQAVGQKAAEKAGVNGEAVEFNDEILELNDDRLDQVLIGLKASNAKAAERTPLVARRKKMQDQESALNAKYGEAINEAVGKHNDAERCWDESLSETQSKRDEAMRERLKAEPALQQQMVEIAKRMGMAQAKGDTAGVKKAQEEMRAFSKPTHADTVNASKKCGPIPPLHPVGAELDSLQRGAAALDERIREIEKQSVDAQAMASGFTVRQFAMAYERIELYLAAVKSNSKPHGFTSSELSSLASHRDALEAAFQ